MEAETVLTRKSQASDSTSASEADDTKPVVIVLPAADTVPSSESQSLATADRPSCETSLEPAGRVSTATSDVYLGSQPSSGEDAREIAEKPRGCSVSCVRDLINTTIEKTLQDTEHEQRLSRTPPTTVSGECLASGVSLPERDR